MKELVLKSMVKNAVRESFNDFNPEKIKAERVKKVEDKVKKIMSRLNYSIHDKRNSKDYVKKTLLKFYNENLGSVITPKQWDEIFSYYSPYSGTY